MVIIEEYYDHFIHLKKPMQLLQRGSSEPLDCFYLIGIFQMNMAGSHRPNKQRDQLVQADPLTYINP